MFQFFFFCHNLHVSQPQQETRDQDDITQGTPGSRVIYFTANPNGEAEIIKCTMEPDLTKKRQSIFLEKDFSDILIKGRAAQKSLLQAFLEPLDTLRKYEDSVTLTFIPANGERLTILRNVAMTQEVDYRENEIFPFRNHGAPVVRASCSAPKKDPP